MKEEKQICERAHFKDIMPFCKQVCEQMIKFMEKDSFDAAYNGWSYNDAIEAAKEYIKTL